MRCPKCHYLSFDPEPRCKNCGYDLEVADAELAFKAAEDYSDPVGDLELRRLEPADPAPVTLELQRDKPAPRRARSRQAEVVPRLKPVIADDDDDIWPARSTPAPAPEPSAPAREPMFRLEPVLEAVAQPESEQRTERAPEPVLELVPTASVPAIPVPAPRERPSMPAVVAVPSVSAHPTTELPLFVRDAPAPPRAPLSVRRTVAEPPRTRAGMDTGVRAATSDLGVGPLDRDLLDDLRRVEREESAYESIQARVRRNADGAVVRGADTYDDPEDIPATQRLAAAALDGVLLGSIGTVALWATLRVTGAGITSFGAEAIVAFLIFLGAVAVAYLLMFTAAGGQTVGKMLMGLRVVGDTVDSIDDQLTVAQAALRAVLAPLSVLALGLGWLPALFGRGLALHDRLAHTRVVRV
jgi:uncharacterized RDD family membrane protein YckC